MWRHLPCQSRIRKKRKKDVSLFKGYCCPPYLMTFYEGNPSVMAAGCCSCGRALITYAIPPTYGMSNEVVNVFDPGEIRWWKMNVIYVVCELKFSVQMFHLIL